MPEKGAAGSQNSPEQEGLLVEREAQAKLQW